MYRDNDRIEYYVLTYVQTKAPNSRLNFITCLFSTSHCYLKYFLMTSHQVEGCVTIDFCFGRGTLCLQDQP